MNHCQATENNRKINGDGTLYSCGGSKSSRNVERSGIESGNPVKEEIRAEHLTKVYTMREKKGLFRRGSKRKVTAVRDLSLTIPRGKIIGLLGINGAGKTTTIRMLSSVLIPTSGSLTLDGVDMVKNPMWVKERINVITGGELNLYWRLTAEENLAYFGSLYGLSKKEVQERSRRLLEMVGLTEAAKTPVERYSKGMKQRLQIARGLINDPEYLFLDEPTLGLDIVIAEEIRKVILALAKRDNRGILLTTHYIREAEELCDEIYILDKGICIAHGTREELAEKLHREPKMVLQEPGLEDILKEIIEKNV